MARATVDVSDILGILRTGDVLDEIGETEIVKHFGENSLLQEIGLEEATKYVLDNHTTEELIELIGESEIINHVIAHCDLPALADKILKKD